LGKHRVRFLVVGAHALAAHGRPRFTGDLDIWVEPTKANAKRVCAALTEFGFADSADLDWFATPQRGLHGVQLGVEPFRIDLLKGISGLSFGTAWKRRLRARLDGKTVFIIGRADFLKNKRASGRTKDLLDIALLEEID
jgi:hypothetical protein